MTRVCVVHRVEQWVALDYVQWKRCARKRSWPTSTVKSKSSTVLANSIGKKLKSSRYRPGVAQRVGRGIALLFHDHGTPRG